VYDGGSFQMIGEREGLTRGSVLAVTEDRSGAVWLGTPSGINRYKNGRLVSLTSKNAPLVDLVPSVVEDDEGYMWVGMKAGSAALRIHPRELDKVATNASAPIEYAIYDESDGFPQGALSWQFGTTGVRGGDGRLWFAAGLGLATINPASTRPPLRRVPVPQIEAASADGRPRGPVARTVPARADLDAAHRVRRAEPVGRLQAAFPLHAGGPARRLGQAGTARAACAERSAGRRLPVPRQLHLRRAVDRGRHLGLLGESAVLPDARFFMLTLLAIASLVRGRLVACGSGPSASSTRWSSPNGPG
jgi:hypothetical protein